MSDTRPQWLIDLDVVETTPKQARQIIRRSKSRLNALANAEPELLEKKVPEEWPLYAMYCSAESTSQIGCPHCLAVTISDYCHKCSWANYSAAEISDEPCVDAIFDGLTLSDVDHIAPISLGLWPDKEKLQVRDDIDEFKIQDIRDCISNIRKFLEAHVTWGEDVIRRATP